MATECDILDSQIAGVQRPPYLLGFGEFIVDDFEQKLEYPGQLYTSEVPQISKVKQAPIVEDIPSTDVKKKRRAQNREAQQTFRKSNYLLSIYSSLTNLIL